MEDFVKRLTTEEAELADKLIKLNTFILGNPTYEELSEYKKTLLWRQERIMKEYLEILRQRITLEKETK